MTKVRMRAASCMRSRIASFVMTATVLLLTILGSSRSFATDTLYPHTLRGVPWIDLFVWPAGFTVIRTETEWKRFWSSSTALSSPDVPPRPSVDFTKDMVIAISLGTAPQGYRMQIVEYSRSQRSVLYELSTRRPGEPSPAVDSRLADMVIVPRTEGNLSFSLSYVSGGGRVRLPK